MKQNKKEENRKEGSKRKNRGSSPTTDYSSTLDNFIKNKSTITDNEYEVKSETETTEQEKEK